MKSSDFTVTLRESLFKGTVFSVEREEVKFPDGRDLVREVVHHRGAVGIVPVTSDGRVVLIEQYRQPARNVIWEVPAGVLEPGEDTEETARRELKEETGGTCEQLVKLSEFYTTPGYSNEYFHLYLALGVVLGPQELEGDEAIEVITLDLSEALEQALNGKIKDGKTILGLILADRYLRDQYLRDDPPAHKESE